MYICLSSITYMFKKYFQNLKVVFSWIVRKHSWKPFVRAERINIILLI